MTKLADTSGAVIGIVSVTVWPACTSAARLVKFCPTVTAPVASFIQRYPRTTGSVPVAVHGRPPSLLTVTVVVAVWPANHVPGTVSLTQLALQSAERKLMSRNGLLKSVFHHEPFVCRSQRTM